ncbi:hypothetical protein [Natronosalvus vescus]|uniref:hypothetical protein n=1 Tax=Natronosalvus vescus TaxID=2953881 RepID=UPI0020918A3A|nr:hypothetical protein [Natronosalvus vescus]
MSTKLDAGLALGVLGSFVLVAIAVDAPLSSPFLVLGGIGTVVFEFVSYFRHEAIRTRWKRPEVQFASVLGAIVLAIVGGFFAPSIVLSVGIGALVTYLVLLGVLS